MHSKFIRYFTFAGVFLFSSTIASADPTWQKVTPGGNLTCSKMITDGFALAVPQAMAVRYTAIGGGGGSVTLTYSASYCFM